MEWRIIMIDKNNDVFLMFCNECDWEEETTGLQYEFCPKCGHVNIGFSKKYNNKNIKEGDN